MTHRTFISIILIAALAVTGLTSTPARAGNDDIAKWIAGAVALGLIGAAIAEDRKRKRAVTRNQAPIYDDYSRRDNRRHQRSHRHGQYNDSLLPAHCRRNIETRNGNVRGFGRRCLLNNYEHFNALPHQCAVRTRGYNGQRRVIYQGRCLRQHGFRVAADHR